MEVDSNVAEGFYIEITPSGDLLLVGVYCLFSVGGRRLLNRYRWRVHDLPLSLAHEEALHHGRPTGVVGAIEHRDEGGEAGRHSLFDFVGEVVSLQTQNQVSSAYVGFSITTKRERFVRQSSILFGSSLLKAWLATSYTVGRC